MQSRLALISGLIAIHSMIPLLSMEPDSVLTLSGVIYNNRYQPLRGCHVVNTGSYAGTTTDSLGIFHIRIRTDDTLWISHIAYRDTIIPVLILIDQAYLILERKTYELPGIRIFPWGSSYHDFREAIIKLPVQQTLGESLGLPRADPGHVPYEMDEKFIRSPGFLFTSPISYLYLNNNRKAKSARKVYWMEKQKDRQDIFNNLTSRENISRITGLSGERLTGFIIFLDQNMTCDLNCREIEILSEIYDLFGIYRKSVIRSE